MKVMVTRAEYVDLEQRLNKISAHVRSLVHVALHERAKNEDVWAENSRTEAGLEFLEVMLDEMLLATLGSDALLTDTVGNPYEAMPNIVQDPDIMRLLDVRTRANNITPVRRPDTPGSVLGAIAGLADAIVEVVGGFETPVGNYAGLIASLASGQITVAGAKKELDEL